MTDPTVTPARLREMADQCEASRAGEWRETAAALRAAADGWEQSRLVAQVNWGQVLELRERHAEMSATLAAREALLKQAEGYVWIIGGLPEYMTVAERSTARSLAAEIAAALNEEKENG